MSPNERLNPSLFKIPMDRIRSGYYSDKYFTRFVEVLKKRGRHASVVYQFFPRQDACIVGLDEAIAILRTCTGRYRDEKKAHRIFQSLLESERKVQSAAYEMDRKESEFAFQTKMDLREQLNDLWEDHWGKIQVKALFDGEMVLSDEVVMTIEGDPTFFGYLETVLLGVMARASSTATAVRKVVSAARRKPILFFSARFDHYWLQATDGYAALKAGAFGVSTDANADYWGAESMGTIPHALISTFHGDTCAAAMAFDECIDPTVNRIVLVDWDNDCIGTTKKVLHDYVERLSANRNTMKKPDLSAIIGPGKGKIWGVRFDTSGSLRDRSVPPQDSNSLGVCPELVWLARKEFDRIGAHDLKIVVSGGFDSEKITLFETLEVPADVYGVGAKLLREKVDLTADIVMVDHKPCAKYGRTKGNFERLSVVSLA